MAFFYKLLNMLGRRTTRTRFNPLKLDVQAELSGKQSVYGR